MKCSFSSQILTNAAKNIRPSHIIATIRNGKFSIGFEDFFKADSFFSEADEKNSKANNNFTQKENIHNKKMAGKSFSASSVIFDTKIRKIFDICKYHFRK